MAAIEKVCPEARNLVVVPGCALCNPEAGPPLATLARVFTQAGSLCGWHLDPSVKAATTLTLP